jgi:hypothetical protein
MWEATMGENVIYLHGQPAPIGHFLRVGTSGHRQLETLLSSGRMGFDRVVFEASAYEHQRDLVAALKESGAELILDTNVAELSCIGRFSGSARRAPWANPAAPLTAEDLAPTANRDLLGQIARFAVQAGFSAVQAPSHLLTDSTDPLFAVDLRSARALREALDREGGRHIGIDYTLMIPNASLRDPVQRRAFIAGLADTPFDNLWFRVSGFGADATAAGLRRYIASAIDFHRLERPIVADGVGGLAGLATIAFGAAGGFAHGAAEKERFNAGDWHKPPKGGGGGREKRVLVSGLDRLLSLKQMEQLMAIPGARRHFSCGDPSCCPRGFDDTVKDPKAHYLRQRRLQVADLAKVPDSRRAQHFLDKQLAPAERHARQAAKLKVEDEALSKMLAENSARLEKAHAVLDNLNGALSGEARSAPPIRRGGTAGVSAQRRR